MYQGLSSSASCCSACCSSLEHSLIAFVVVHDVTCVDVSPLINIVASAAVNERPLLLDETRLARRIDDEPVIAVDVDVDAVVVVVVAVKPASSKITIICNTQISIFSPTTTKKKKKKIRFHLFAIRDKCVAPIVHASQQALLLLTTTTTTTTWH